MRLKNLAITLLLFLLLASPVRADSVMVIDIAKQLICQCGCTSVLSNCVHGECMVRDEMLKLIEQKLAQGQSEAQIVQFFVAQYGEQVLASPPKRGFNLTAWITPFVAIVAGAALIFFILKKWVWQGRQSETIATEETKGEDEEYRRRVEKELMEFKERGFR